MQDNNLPTNSSSKGISIIKLVLLAMITIYLGDLLVRKLGIDGVISFVIQVILLTSVVFFYIKKMKPNISARDMSTTAVKAGAIGLAVPVVALLASLLFILMILFFAAF